MIFLKNLDFLKIQEFLEYSRFSYKFKTFLKILNLIGEMIRDFIGN